MIPTIFNFTRLKNACVSFLKTEMKIQIRAPNELTNRIYALRIMLALRLRMKLAEMHVLFRKRKLTQSSQFYKTFQFSRSKFVQSKIDPCYFNTSKLGCI